MGQSCCGPPQQSRSEGLDSAQEDLPHEPDQEVEELGDGIKDNRNNQSLAEIKASGGGVVDPTDFKTDAEATRANSASDFETTRKLLDESREKVRAQLRADAEATRAIMIASKQKTDADQKAREDMEKENKPATSTLNGSQGEPEQSDGKAVEGSSAVQDDNSVKPQGNNAVQDEDNVKPQAPESSPTGPKTTESTAAPVQLQVLVPEGTAPGSTLQVQAPDGRTVQITVPAGVKGGQTITVQI